MQEDSTAPGQSQYDLYAVARELLSELAVVAVIDPVHFTLSCKPMFPDVSCSVMTTAPISACMTIGCSVSLDEEGKYIMDNDSYLEYSVISLLAQGNEPIVKANFMVVCVDCCLNLMHW